ncbi:DNRLRE domain-containing protein [Cytophaga sp. FL35]|uniref:CBM96 family carbohydrate-binding protein n=1 Tax=Cytophaga sp. FL35 TaxID=1904456 RepID=UPI001653BCF2|nr:DNRLRE domain-containing protein [Cytophaga sp. FL35]MBC7000713.1 DNRLRE domain-containing protein [Cytophaga sp. FL35]
MKSNLFIHQKLILPIFALLIGLQYGCEIQENFEYQEAGVEAQLGISAWDYIRNSDSLVILESAIVRAELQSLFNDSKARTYIAPTNMAFSEYFEANGYTGIEEVPLPILRNLLKYHIVDEKVVFTDPDLFEGNKPLAYTTQNGQIMYLSHDSNFIGLVNQGTGKQWSITSSNLEALDDAIHVVGSLVYFSAPQNDLNVPDPTIKTDTIFPLFDTYINGGGQSGANFGADPLIKIKNVSDNGDYDRKGFLMFDLKDFDEEGVITDIRLEMAVKFTHAKGVAMDLYATPDTTWTEMGLTFDNAVFPDNDPIASITTTKVSTFDFNITDYVTALESEQRISLMLDGEAGSDETDEFGSKENADFNPPMLIATLGSGNSFLNIVANNGFTVDKEEAYVWNANVVEIDGASAGDIIYTLEQAPSNGWLITGAQTLQVGDKFTQQDINLMNVVYINNGSGTSDVVTVSAKDRVGSVIDAFEINIGIN